MHVFKVALFDVDGVLTLPERLFGHVHADTNGLTKQSIDSFFAGDFQQALVGKADLKDLIRQHHETWRWQEEPDQLLEQWFEAENAPNEPLLAYIAKRRAAGLTVCLATNQEKYRAAYLREVMFPGLFDHVFVSCELGVLKTDRQFFKHVFKVLAKEIPDLQPSEIVYFDDSQPHVESAAELGITACLYQAFEQVPALLG